MLGGRVGLFSFSENAFELSVLSTGFIGLSVASGCELEVLEATVEDTSVLGVARVCELVFASSGALAGSGGGFCSWVGVNLGLSTSLSVACETCGT